MAYATEYELISHAVDFALSTAESAEAQLVERLKSSGSTVLVNGLRTVTMHSTILAIGSFSVFESVLKQNEGWDNPFPELETRLRASGSLKLAQRFNDYRNAINVLKHGSGPSYQRLIDRKDQLEFKIKESNDSFFDEGDVSEGIRLVDADHAFVRQCAEIISQVTAVLNIKLFG